MKLKVLFCWCIAPLFASAQKVTVTSGAVMTIHRDQTLPTLVNKGRVVLTENKTLTLTGTASGTGMLSVEPTSSLVISNPAGGIVYFDPTHNTLKDLSVYGGFVLGNTLNIAAGSSAGKVKLRGHLFSDSFLVLKSDLYGTARIDSSAGYLYGPVTVERYIPARRAWRLLTVPFVSSTQSINQAWQEGNANTTLACISQYIGTPGYGTHLTYNGQNGFDPNVTTNPSIVWFSSALNKWLAPPSTLTPKITDYPAYAVFVRGDRTVCLTQGVSAAATHTTLRANGIVSVGTTVHSYTAAPGQYLLEGNPYASSIDLLPMSLRSTGIIPESWWLWDPHEGTTGVYVSYNHGLSAPLTTNYPDPISARIAQSGQGYLLKAVSTSQTIHYEEADKVSTSTTAVFARPTTQDVIHVQLCTTDRTLIDGVAARVVEHDTSAMSSPKAWNFNGACVALTRGGQYFGIETRLRQDLDTSYLYFKQMESAAYMLEVFGTSTQHVRLLDRLLGIHMPIIDTLRYTFETTDSLTWLNRFVLVRDAPDTVPMHTRISLYPNPVHDVLSISGVAPGTKLRITDVSGRVLLVTSAQRIHCAFLASGTYFVSIGQRAYRFHKL